jgi:hypothetical protein
MNTPTTAATTDFGQTFTVLASLQADAIECMQKLGRLNLAAWQASVSEVPGMTSTGQLDSSTFAAGFAGVQQQMIERTQSYTQHVKEIEAQFQASLSKAGEALRDQFSAGFAQFGNVFGANAGQGFGQGFGQFTPFNPTSAFAAMQSAMTSMIDSGSAMQETIKRASGASRDTASTALSTVVNAA